MKKISIYILILIVSIGFFGPMREVKAETCTGFNVVTNTPTPDGCTSTTPITGTVTCTGVDPTGAYTPAGCTGGYTPSTPTTTPANSNYNLLAPLPNPAGGTMSNVPTGDSSAFSGYLNMMIKLFIGICAVLAVIMIVVGGIEYMTSELISSKEAGKERIRNAIFGLLLALGAWTLLNAINPNLLDSSLKNLTSVTVTVTADQANFAATEQTTASVGTGYKLSGTPSSGVTDFANNSCSSLSKVTVNTATKQASFCSRSSCVSVPVNLGYKGVAEVGQAKSGDSKTPKGTFTTSGDIRLGNSGNAVISNNGYNLGAAFVNIGAKDSSGNDRGIGFHGNEQDTLGTTNGCIRMSNDDLTLLAPCIKTGTTISII